MLRDANLASLMCSDGESIRPDRAACKWGLAGAPSPSVLSILNRPGLIVFEHAGRADRLIAKQTSGKRRNEPVAWDSRTYR